MLFSPTASLAHAIRPSRSTRRPRLVRAGFTRSALTASVLTKRPLPADLPLSATISRHAHHDALLIAARMAQTPEGLAFVRSAAFMRYLAYLLSITSLGPTLEVLNKTCLELFQADEDPFLSLRV